MKNLIYILIFLPFICSGQTIMVNGAPYLATQNNSFPFWLDAGSTLSPNPPMNFISVVEYNENEVGDDKNLGYSKVLSITESSVVPDGKVWKVISALQYHYEGCTDETMFNFDPQANVDDGSCVEIVEGCLDPDYVEYSAEANIDDGTCETYGIFGCADQIACNFDPIYTVNDESCIYELPGLNCDGDILQIGDFSRGGIVFQIAPSGLSGLVASVMDIGGFPWGCNGINFVSTSSGLGTGNQNTINIVNSCESDNGEMTAAQAAYEYVSGGYDDWYLPSKDDLYLMKTVLGENNNNIGQFVEAWYWTSTHGTGSQAWNEWPFSFSQEGHHSTKNNPNYVRPIRTF